MAAHTLEPDRMATAAGQGRSRLPAGNPQAGGGGYPPDGEEQVEVLLGTMRAKIPLYQLEGLAGGSSSPGGSLSPGPTTGGGHPGVQHFSGENAGLQQNRPSQRPGSRRNFNPEVDLRGQRVEEALGNVDGLLDTAAVQGVQEVRIIHGTGTGALRRAIREYLKDHPLVESSAPPRMPLAKA